MSTFTDDSTIDDNETIWRRVSDAVDDSNLNRKRPSTACFLQDGPDGPVSVYLASEAISHKIVMENAKEPFLVELNAGFIRQLGIGIIRDPSSGGPGHALLTGRKTRGKRNKMAKAATWVDPYKP